MKIFKSLSSMRLKKEEKDDVRNNLMNYMKKNPVRIPEDKRLHISQRFGLLIKNTMRSYMVKPFYAILILALVSSGGIGVMAQGAVPGDFLYPYKVYVNENARALVTFTNKGSAELSLDLAIERLQEASELAEDGKLDSKNRADLEQMFNERVDLGYGLLINFKNNEKFKDQDDVMEKFLVDLDSQAKVLTDITSQTGNIETKALAVSAALKASEINDEDEDEDDIEVKSYGETEIETENKVDVETNEEEEEEEEDEEDEDDEHDEDIEVKSYGETEIETENKVDVETNEEEEEEEEEEDEEDEDEDDEDDEDETSQ